MRLPHKKALYQVAYTFSVLLPVQLVLLVLVMNRRWYGVVGMKKYEHRGRQWHAECFVCIVCQVQIGTTSFIPRGSDIVCVPCYERQYSQSCTKCGLVR